MLPTEVLLGPAGTGKSTRIRERAAKGRAMCAPILNEDGFSETAEPSSEPPSGGGGERLLLTATTGVAAFNMGDGCSTINSLMKFFNTETLYKNMRSQMWAGKAYAALKEVDTLCIDEVSMMPYPTLDALSSVFFEFNNWREMEGQKPMKVLLSGDFLQLPPVVKDNEMTPYPFLGQWWNSVYAPNVEILRKIYRQDNPQFQQALWYARCGDAINTSYAIQALGARFYPEPWYNFDGFTIYPVNASVNKHNEARLKALKGQGFSLVAERWGTKEDEGQSEESFWNSMPELSEIPYAVGFKEGCRVRFTANSQPAGMYVNGQLGTLKGLSQTGFPVVECDSKETPYEVTVPWHFRIHYRPATKDDDGLRPKMTKEKWWFEEFPRLLQSKETPFLNPYTDQVATAVVKFIPLNLGYAATIHKSQGLTFDRLQIDLRSSFAVRPQMAYVALSRLRSPEGLCIIGKDSNILARRVSTDPILRNFI